MKKIFTLLFCAAALFSVTSCSDSDETDVDVTIPDTDTDGDDDVTPDDPETVVNSYLYVLNCGLDGYNNASITRYNTETEDVLDDLFVKQNDILLGDLGQDMIQFGDKLFIALTGSNIIYVTDLEGTKITSIQNESPCASPRYFATDGEYVYVSYKYGAVAKIDPETYEFTYATTSNWAEQIVVVDGKLYAAIPCNLSWEYFTTIEVFDTATMTYEKSIEVATNPSLIEADGLGNLYVVSMGNYWSTFSTLQKIDIESGEVSVLNVTEYEDSRVQAMTIDDNNVLYVVAGLGVDGDYTLYDPAIYAYDAATGSSSKFITDGTVLDNMYNISVNSENGEVYLATSIYNVTGDMYIFNADGTLKDSFGVGYCTMMALPISIEE